MPASATRPDVLLNDFHRMWSEIGADVHGAVERVGASGWYVLGSEVDRFETELASHVGLAHAIGTGNGLDAIEIALRCLGIGPGDTVLTTPLSAFATTLAVLRAGASVSFVDVDASGLLDLERAADRLARGGVRCLLPVHLYGHSVDLDRLRALADRHGVALVEDCAQAVGATWRDRPVGSAGEAAATSFYPTKNLGALGDGGAVLTASTEHAATARALRHYGQVATYEHAVLGLNSRLDELQAAMMSDAMLPRLGRWTARRREVAGLYRATIDHPRLAVPPVPAGSGSVWHLFPVLVEPELRESFQCHLRAAGVQSGRHYPRVIPDQEALRDERHVEVCGALATARRFAAGEVSLPIHPWLTDEEVERVAAACNDWSGR